MYQEILYKYLIEVDGMKLGGKDKIVVIDESAFGLNKGIRKIPQKPKGTPKQARSKTAVRKRILKRLPAQTLWRKGYTQKAMKMKKRGVKAMKVQKKNDKRSNSKWLWGAVEVGYKKKVYTHGAGNKRFTFNILPRPLAAPDGKPRGLRNIRSTLSQFVKKGTFLVFDKWLATVSAVKQLGFNSAPPVNHSKWFRDRSTGFHSNDIESEFNRLKKWLCQRYGRLQLDVKDNEEDDQIEALDVYEYMYYNNVGSSMSDVMKAFHHYNDGVCRPCSL